MNDMNTLESVNTPDGESFHHVDNLRIQALRPLLPPAILIEEHPLGTRQAELVRAQRHQIAQVLGGDDDRLMVLAGPCSIHDVGAALDYAQRLKQLAERYGDELLVIMRVYFEKPRTVVGWKGLINDPHLDGSFRINTGLRMARQLLLDVLDVGLAAGTEFLDTIIPQFLADVVAWAAIGARTTESQVHRELASGLSMPVGFKNGTSGDVQVAIDAIRSARCPHWFPSVTKQGVTAIFSTTGNETAHLILRGGPATGPNHTAPAIAAIVERLLAAELPGCVVVDCSHGNSEKDYQRQPFVAADLASQIAGGNGHIRGVMLESFLVEGSQPLGVGSPPVYGQSVTDGCISLPITEDIFKTLAVAVRQRRKASGRGQI